MPAPARTFHSVCPYDCPDACGLLVTVENGRVTRVAGDREHPFTRGLLCGKMAHYERTVHSPRRLVAPLLRTGRKGGGQFRPISWDEAVQRIADRWKAIIAHWGAEAILPYSYAGTMGLVQHDAMHALFYALGASELDRTICTPAKRHAWRAVMGATRGMRPQEAQESDCIVLWGLSALATNLHFTRDMAAARRRGAQIWLIDAYETETARLADRCLRVRPGTDACLALGVMRILVAEGLTDADFLREHTQGWNELRERVLPRYTPEYVRAVTSVPEEELRAFALAYGRARAPFIRLGSGLSRYANGAATCRCIISLPAVVGAWAKPGGGILASISGSAAFDRTVVRREDFRIAPRRVLNMCRLGDILLHEAEPPVKSLFVYSSNPACTAPEQNSVLAGLAREDLFTVVHERFLTDTARYADIVLPATTSLEHSDIYAAYGHYGVGLGRAVIPPVGEARSNWRVAQTLARALGLPQQHFARSEDELIDALIQSTQRCWPLPVDRERLAAGLPVELPLPEGYKTDFRTPSGKIELCNPAEERPLPDYVPAHGDDAEFHFINAPDRRVLDSSFNERDDLVHGPLMELRMHPQDAARLGLADGSPVEAWNTRGSVPFTLRVSPRVAPGTVVCEGVWWLERVREDTGASARNSVNALTSQRLTDCGGGSTFYDVKVNVRSAAAASRLR
ncbi:molybdopterin-dependent oxidoreductase [uncultured Desulfovibrio sp.]|uniref:molybdopterin-dependent oxidoreductase n=1 Tax=uncultured Desulfovibrio sp. TaxID=167968 RepID=UPI00261382F3|nr:molybdopterin-dependent oxidoreductase [uncultured Desulfovibrio sp.]